MPALPRFNLRLSLIVFFLSLFTLSLSSPAHAAPGGLPTPQPCKNPIKIEEQDFSTLTDNYITGEKGKALEDLRWDDENLQDGRNSLIVEGARGDIVDLPPVTFSFTVDFSKLQALFADPNSNYLEGKFRADEHRFANILDLSSQDFNSYHGPSQKGSPKVLVDDLKKKYVEYVFNKPELWESDNKYTDIEGAGDPKNIYDLVNVYGLPEPPRSGEDRSVWLSTWGRYWEKIPTAYSEFYEGEIAFHYILGRTGLEQLKRDGLCPPRAGDTVRIVLPEFFRTTAISDHLNRLIVAKEAQSYQNHGILTAQKPDSLLAKSVRFCWDLIKNSASNLKKVVKISFDLLNPLDAVYAQNVENRSCLRPIPAGKEGLAPYCPLPLEEANKLGVSCRNQNDQYKLEEDNPNVICTFTRTFTGFVEISPDSVPENDPENAVFDSCEALPDGRYRCRVPLAVYPNIRIPWLAAIWNNTLYSDESEYLDDQKTGRPGIFGAFTPKVIQNPLGTNLSAQEILDLCEETDGQDPLCEKLGAEWSQCVAEGREGLTGLALAFYCLGETLKLPASTPDSEEEDPKERFLGGVDCSKNFVRDVALKPKALQQVLGISSECNLVSTASFPVATTPPVDHPGTDDDCSGKYSSTGQYPSEHFAQTGNFGDPACDYSESQLFTLLQNLDPASANFWFFTIVNCESRYNPNSFNPAAVDPAGGWGLFQMGRGLNGPLDHGDVPWGDQTQNAVRYKNEVLGGGFSYWECANI